MAPTRENAEAMIERMDQAHKKLSVRAIEEARSNDEARRQNARRVFVEPVSDAGYDFDATLRHYSQGLIDGSFTQEEAEISAYFLTLYRASMDDLMRWGFLKKDTHELMTKALAQ